MTLDQDIAAFGSALKPRVAQVLRAVGLDVSYERAEGDHLWHRDADGALRRVTDLVGGYGASFVGHNHPVLVARAQRLLAEQRPFNAQASIRGLAGRLAERLSELVGRRTGRSYVVTLASTGAEAVEAAIKHAELELVERIDAIRFGNERVAREAGMSRGAGGVALDPRTRAETAAALGGEVTDAATLVARVREHNARVLATPPLFVALTGAFHGKTTGAVSLTANAKYRRPWRRSSLRAAFVPPGDIAALDAALDAAELRYFALSITTAGELAVEVKTLTNAACFVEPIQGEGGVREIPGEFLRALRDRADARGFPLVFDEIQSGMGRTGTLLASEAAGVRGDYYLLSKSLGGGLAKISALLIDASRYRSEFGYLHSSTFAEDDFASAIALEVLGLITADDEALLRTCAAKGTALRQRLGELQRRHPDLIVEIRGRGLMLGIELAAQTASPSNLLRVASEQDLLGYLVAGHLLAEHAIRVVPTMSSPHTLRIQPSVYIDDGELEHFTAALDRVLAALRAGDAGALVGHLVGHLGGHLGGPLGGHLGGPLGGGAAAGQVRPRRRAAPVTGDERSVVFLAHFLEPGDLRSWDPSLGALDDAQCAQLLERTRDVLEPFITHRDRVTSATGASVALTVVALPFTSAQVMAGFRAGDLGWLHGQIDAALEFARAERPAVIGFGGYTSILTNNCTAVAEGTVVVTSGNSLTTAAAADATLAEIARLGLGRIRLGIVGAVGNIGTVLADVLAEHVDSVVLVGRPAAAARLGRRAEELYAAAWARLARGAAGGMFARLAGSARLRAVAAAHPSDRAALGRALRAAHVEEVGEANAVIGVATDLAALRDCNAIVSATNAPCHVIGPEHVGAGPVVLCDIAMPGDVSPAVARQRPHATVLKGGLVHLPSSQIVAFGGMQLPPGQIYGCLAETVLLGLSGATTSLSCGPLSADRVRDARHLARVHGFELAARPLPLEVPCRSIT